MEGVVAMVVTLVVARSATKGEVVLYGIYIYTDRKRRFFVSEAISIAFIII